MTAGANLDDRTRPRFVATGATHTGRTRAANEDTARILAELGLFIVADGVSGENGNQGGAEASQLAADTIAEDFASDGETTAPSIRDTTHGLAAGMLRAAIEHAHRRIYEAGRRTQRPHMATTVAALLVAGPRVVLAHVGDSRIYRLRHGELTQLTTDHTELALWEQMHRRPAPPEVRKRCGHVLVRALGGQRTGSAVDVRVEPWRRGDLFLLCSDGLHGLVGAPEMTQILRGAPDLDCAVVRLVKRANDAGGHDNITAIALRMLG